MELKALKEPRQDGNFSNNAYNLLAQLTEENKSLWRIKNSYRKDAEDDFEVQQLWADLEEAKKGHIKRLTAQLAKHIQT